LARFKFESEIVCFVFLSSLFRLENRVCLSRGAPWHAAMRIMAKVGDLVQRTGEGRTGRVLGGREVGWRCVRSAPCTWGRRARVSWLSLKTKVDSLSVVWPQNHWHGFHRFGLKTGGDDL
jgi:hypothetical protein